MNNNDIRETFKRFRTALKESEEQIDFNPRQNGVPYTQQDELFQNSVEVTKQQFGADYSKLKTPMYYYKEDGDVTLTGNIPGLNDATFQFSYKGYPNGCFFQSGKGAMILTDEVIKKLSRIYGVYKNWQNDLNVSEDIRPMNLKNED